MTPTERKRELFDQQQRIIEAAKRVRGADLIALTGIHRATLNNVLNGRTAHPSWVTLQLIAQATRHCAREAAETIEEILDDPAEIEATVEAALADDGD